MPNSCLADPRATRRSTVTGGSARAATSAVAFGKATAVAGLLLLGLPLDGHLGAAETSRESKIERDADGAIDHRSTVRPLGEVEIDVPAGTLRIVGTAGEELRISGRTAADTDGPWLLVEDRWSRIRIRPTGTFPDPGPDPGLELTIRLPASSDLVIRTLEAKLELENIDGRIEIESVDGPTHLVGSPRELRLSSIAGSVDLDIESPKAVVESISGPISVRGALTQLRAETVDSDLRVDAAIGVEGFLRTVTGELIFGGELASTARLRTHASSGATSVQLDPELGAHIRIESISGTLSNAFGPTFGAPIDGRHLLELEGQGPSAAKLELFSISGPLTLSTRTGSPRDTSARDTHTPSSDDPPGR